MGDEQAESGFWRSLPGILTALGTFLAGLAGLAAVVVPNFFGKRDAPVEQAAQKPANAPADPPAELANTSATNAPALAAVPAPAPAAAAPTPAIQTVAPAPATESTASDRFITAFASDGFVVLRAGPTIASAEIRRVDVGVAVRCGLPRWNADGYRRRRCVDQEGEAGYMADNFLRRA